MNIDKITITGADDSISVNDLIEISQEYPIVEWGILLSKKNMGSNRFPSAKWLDSLAEKRESNKINLSAHICGKWMIDIRSGVWSVLDEVKEGMSIFDRIQINFGSTISDMSSHSLIKSTRDVPYKFQYIFQIKNPVHLTFVELFRHSGHDCVPLFDASGGRGELPEKWPEYPGYYCGYAGGLSPDNIKNQLNSISNVVPEDKSIWIDVESKVRSSNDVIFDLKKVRSFLKNSLEFLGALKS